MNFKTSLLINHNLSNKILLFIFFLFPLILILRSAAINTTLIFVSVFSLIFYIKKININYLKNKFLIFFIIFFFYLFINALINNQDFILILKSLANYRYLILSITVYFVLCIISNKLKKIFIYFNCFLIIFFGFDIFYQFFFQKDIFGFVPGMCDSFGKNCQRFSGVFGNEYIGGGYLSQIGLLFFFLLSNLNKEKNYFIIASKILFLVFLFSTIVVTGERNALLIFLLSMLFYNIYQKKFLNLILIFLSFFIVIFILSQKIEFIKNRFISPLNSLSTFSTHNDKTSATQKIIDSPWVRHYQAAIELFLERPLTGHGVKSFRVRCEETIINKQYIKINESYTACSSHPHNYLMEFLAEYGLIGAVFFLSLLLGIALKLFSIKNKSTKEAKILLGLGCLLLAIMFPLKPSGSFLSTFNASILFYIFGFFLYYSTKVK
jgi:O-antigen ligase